MPDVQQSQGGSAPVPPIPKMETAPPAAQTRSSARDLAQQARDAGRADRPFVAPVGVPGMVVQPFRERDIPHGAVEITQGLFVTIAICVIGAPLARAIGRRLDRRSDAMKVSDGMAPQIRQLQDSVDAMAIELERISEGQRFTSKLLAERAQQK